MKITRLIKGKVDGSIETKVVHENEDDIFRIIPQNVFGYLYFIKINETLLVKTFPPNILLL